MTGTDRPYRIIAVEGIDGSGKSTLAANLVRLLGPKARYERLSPRMASVFRELVDEPSQQRQRYQDVIPDALRRSAFLVDAQAQFHYLEAEYAAYDWLVFDRWLTTYDVYAPERGMYEDFYQLLMDDLPRPDLLLHVRTPPPTAFARIAQRGDWTVDHWSADELMADLERLDAAYATRLAGVPHTVVDGSPPAEEVAGHVLGLIHALDRHGESEAAA
ncbi:deoxynucleoside kinase [Streptomyces sp. NPDC005899]|uniref:deoxynucleoside kinase n=1 Tax=Streptomyces sp. NPDC005899 TaxID=3155716 RepID=UPI00341190C2